MGEKGLRGWVFRHIHDDLRPSGWEFTNGTAFNPKTGQNAAWDPEKGAYVDTKTGQVVGQSIYK